MTTMRTSPREYWRLLAVYLAPQRGRTALLGLFLVASISIQLVSPLILRRFIDRASEGATLHTLLILAGLYVGFAILVQAIRLAETWTATWVGWTATNNLRADLARHVLGLDMAFHNRNTPGTLIERVDGDVFTLANFFSRFVINVLGNLLLTIGVVVILLSDRLAHRRSGRALRTCHDRRADAPRSLELSPLRRLAGGLLPDHGLYRRADQRHRGHPLGGRNRLCDAPQP